MSGSIINHVRNNIESIDRTIEFGIEVIVVYVGKVVYVGTVVYVVTVGICCYCGYIWI